MSAGDIAAADDGEPRLASPVFSARGGKRRKDIFTALHDCVIDRGYAKTTLAEVARSAGMTPSHLLYYFAGKDAILEQYFAHFAHRIMERIDAFRSEAPERQIFLVADLFFGGRNVAKSEIGFMLECFGAAVHDKPLKIEKTKLDRFCKSYLEELFERLPCGPARARDCAEVAYALLVGLRTAAYFDEQHSPGHARRLFFAEVSNLANPVRVAGRARGSSRG